MVLYTGWVPVKGLVDWDKQKMASFARELLDEHRPSRRLWKFDERCVSCGARWPCDVGIWALGEVGGGAK